MDAAYLVVDARARRWLGSPLMCVSAVLLSGLLVCSEIENGWVTMQFGKGDPSTDQLVEVFRNGVITTEYTFESIRKRASVPYKDAGRKD